MSDRYDLLSTSDKTYIEDLIRTNVLTSLIKSEFDVVIDGFKVLVNYLANKLSFDKTNVSDYITLLKENNNRHIYSLFKMLFPHIDDTNNFALFKEITQLSDISCKKKPQKTFDKFSDENPYLITNIQFNKAIIEKDSFTEYKYREIDFFMNLELLFETIDMCRSKLYVNWSDILPLTIEDYKESRLYKQSPKVVNNKLIWNGQPFKKSFYKDDEMFYYGGISHHEMFNTIFVFLFKDIYNSGCKWLLYEQQMNENEKPKTYVEILFSIIPYNLLSQPFDTLSKSDIEKMTEEWINIKHSEINLYRNFLKCVIIKFDRQFCDEEIEKTYNYDSESFYEKFIKESKNVNLDDEDSFLDLTELDINDSDFKMKVTDFFNKIPISVIFDFFNDVINKFNRTWYGKNMISKTGTINKLSDVLPFNNELNFNNKTFYVSFKNLYNYAKYVSIEVYNNVINDSETITNSQCLSNGMWDTFFNILNSEHPNQFKISRVLRRTYINISKNEGIAIQEFIDKSFKKSIVDLTFIIHINVGLLTELKPCPELTNKKLIGSNSIGKLLKQKYVNTPLGNKYLNTEYYLTGEKYSNLELYDQQKRINWFEHLFKRDDPWINLFALTFVTQMTFYHHFLNNRVMFVTGSTGQGKSVLVPILYYYANIALKLNFKTKVLSTQVLVIATTSNSKFMSNNLGVPLELNNIKTFNSYIQYSTEADKHLVKRSDTFIKEVTDRTLLEELKTNQILKRKKGSDKFTNENLYDVIIIDEAHMHNVGIDMILTIIRNAVLINNQIKLVITSATMDDDEYIYRRFYRYIDENFMFPLRPKPFSLMPNIGLDRNVVDRRFHISPPNETNRFAIEDIYLNVDTKNYEEAEMHAIETVKKIMNNVKNDILFFTIGDEPVKNITRVLNSFLPTDMIALPLYSKMRQNSNSKAWFEGTKGNLKEFINNITCLKEDVLDVILYGPDNYPKYSKGRYKRAIVVATNVVEASVTIDSLEYVIDTGYAINVKFDSINNEDVVSIDKISEASRLQRRGRVGRVAPGTVYYMYSKGSRANIKPKYDMVTTDITFDVFSILADSCNKKFANLNVNPQRYSFAKEQLTYKEFLMLEENKVIKNIYLKQYMFDYEDTQLIKPFSTANTSTFSIDFNYSYGIMYETGYGIFNLIDHLGTFYLIHPSENLFKRNIITGDIVVSNETDPTYLPMDQKCLNIFSKLEFLKYIYYDDFITVLSSPNTDHYLHKFSYIKLLDELKFTERESFSFITKSFTDDHIIKFIKTLFIGDYYNERENVLKILSVLYSAGKLENLIRRRLTGPVDDQGNFIYRMKVEFLDKWHNNESELLAFKNIMDHFKHYYEPDKTTSFISTEKVLDRYSMFVKAFKKHGYKMYVDTKLILKEGLALEEADMFIENINRSRLKDDIVKNYNLTGSEVLLKHSDIDHHCLALFLDTDTVMKAINTYKKFDQIFKSENVINVMKHFQDVYLMPKTTFNPIIISFLENYNVNICKYNNGKFYKLINKNEIKKPVTLTNIFPSYYFYCIEKNLGLTPITDKMVKSVWNIKSSGTLGYIGNQYNDAEPDIYEPDLLSMTNRIRIVDPKNKDLDSNKTILTEINKILNV